MPVLLVCAVYTRDLEPWIPALNSDRLRLLGTVAADQVRYACRAHLRELRHVGVAQHEADIGMRDQSSLRVDDVGMAALADLDLRDHIPDELEIDFGDAHTGVAPGAGNGQRHVRLGFAAEIDRAV